jgi:hypothetical protein
MPILSIFGYTNLAGAAAAGVFCAHHGRCSMVVAGEINHDHINIVFFYT